MKLSLNTNIGSLTAQNQLLKASEKLQTSFERLSSGLRINRASDDPAGLAMASGLQTDSRLMAQAVRNVNDGISLLTIAEGALKELNNILGRQAELAQQAANEVYTSEQRQGLQKESQALVQEFNRIINTTEFNGIFPLSDINKQISIQAGLGDAGTITFELNEDLSRTVQSSEFTPGLSAAMANTIGSITGDLDGDGNADLIMAQYSNSRIVVMLGNGNGTFNASTPFNTGTQPWGLASADFNGDGEIDIVTSNKGASNLSVLLGNGDGTFNAARSLAAPGVSLYPTTGDFNGDGNVDIATGIGGATDVAQIYLGNGDGTFQTGASFAIGDDPYHITSADLNADGHLDLVAAATQSDSASVLLGKGDGTFEAVQNYYIGTHPYVVRTHDVNFDGILDILAPAYDSDVVSVLIGRGDGRFEDRRTYATEQDPYWMDLADLNSDGITDLFTVNRAQDTVGLMLGNIDGSFYATTTFSIGMDNPHCAVVADFNNDNLYDIFTASFNTDIMSLFLGTGTLATSMPYLNLMTTQDAQESLERVELDLGRVSAELGNIGAAQSRLSHTVNHLQVMRENYAAASSKIVDVDIAEEVAQMVRQQIIQQAITAVMAQANQQPALVLQLLK